MCVLAFIPSLHAQVALANEFPPFLDFMDQECGEELDGVIAALNRMISQADATLGCPVKAVSFHGDLREEDGLLIWEMIVDV